MPTSGFAPGGPDPAGSPAALAPAGEQARRALEIEIQAHQAALRQCRQCPDMHPPPVVGEPVCSPVMLLGQAPGSHEGEAGRPFAWTAGKTLFQWFARIGLPEEAFRQRVYMAAVCRCYPGRQVAASARRGSEAEGGDTSAAESGSESAASSGSESAARSKRKRAAKNVSEGAAESGSEGAAESGSAGATRGSARSGGDRVPNRAEIERCHAWLAAEVALLTPRLIIPVGRLAMAQVMTVDSLTEIVGRQHRVRLAGHEIDAIPLPHPSGVSTWHKTAPGKELLDAALRLIAEHEAFAGLLP
jgi:uracil-DNA glycosylase